MITAMKRRREGVRERVIMVGLVGGSGTAAIVVPANVEGHRQTKTGRRRRRRYGQRTVTDIIIIVIIVMLHRAPSYFIMLRREHDGA